MRRRDFLCAGTALAVTGPWRARAAASEARVVIAGGGFAGACCALQLRRLNPRLHVTLIDPDQRYVTCPMSNAVLVDLRDLASITLTRAALERAGVRFVRDRVNVIDATRRRVRLQSGGRLPYERLVVAPGIRLVYGQPQGYDEAAAQHLPHAWQAGTQTELLARQLHAVRDGGTVALSVPAGLMRCPPGPYERATLIAWWLSTHRSRCKVLIFDSNNHFPRQDVFTAAWADRYPGMIEWIASTEGGAVTRVAARSRTLYSASGAHTVAVANVIPPQAPGRLAADAGLAHGHGWCPVRAATFESELVERVHVIGDACIAGAMPKAASAARSQALRCAAAIVAELGGGPAPASELSSVCYSLLGPTSALAIRARFTDAGGTIEPDASGAAQAEPPGPADDASQWYRQIRADCFGA